MKKLDDAKAQLALVEELTTCKAATDILFTAADVADITDKRIFESALTAATSSLSFATTEGAKIASLEKKWNEAVLAQETEEGNLKSVEDGLSAAETERDASSGTV